VYDFGHIGNFRTFVFADLLRRYFEFRGFRVNHVMNITDVEDKIMRLVYIVTWFNEKAATTPEEREALECCKDYYLMSNLIGQTFPPQPTTTPKLVLAMLGDFPIAASCLKTMGSIDEMLVEQLQKQISH